MGNENRMGIVLATLFIGTRSPAFAQESERLRTGQIAV